MSFESASYVRGKQHVFTLNLLRDHLHGYYDEAAQAFSKSGRPDLAK